MTSPTRRSRLGLALLVAALLAAACGADDGRLAELESENQALREQLEAATSTTAATSSTTTTTSSPQTTAERTDNGAAPPAPSTTQAAAPGTTATPEGVPVLSVTDGDTMRVAVDGVNERLRLIGINAPEQGECLSVEATRRLAELVGEGPVQLESDVSDRDDFERLLRYVYVGDVFVNETLVREGLAVARRYEPDTARHDQLEAAQSAAQADEVGMWDPSACGTSSSDADIQITQIRYDADGDDNHNLNDEWVEFTNAAKAALDLTGWGVKDESAIHRYSFPSGFGLPPNATVRLHTGCGDDTDTSLYWCKTNSAVWNNSGDTVFVLDPDGNVVTSRSY